MKNDDQFVTKSLSGAGALRWLDNNQKLAALAVASILFLLLQIVAGITNFPFDSGGYWRLSAFGRVLESPIQIRGYFYPLLLWPARYLSDTFPELGYAPYRVISSIAYAYILTNLLPAFYNSVFGGCLNFWRRLLVPVLVLILFPGIILYPLSDFPAIALMLAAVVCTLRSAASGVTALKRYALLLLSGVFTYGAYNTRTIFIFPMILFVAAFAPVVYRDYGPRFKLYASAAFLMGMLVASIPQIFFNYQHHGVWSPAVITTINHKSLFAAQLLAGISVQRYETTIDESAPRHAVYYMDPSGEQLLAADKIDKASFDIDEYFALMLKHPLDFLGIFGRHLVNGLDVRDGDLYTEAQSPDRNVRAIFNFIVVFLGLAIILLGVAAAAPPFGGKDGERLFLVLVMTLPVLAIIPGEIETRYFLAAHLSIYAAIAFSSDVMALQKLMKRHWLAATMIIGLSASLFFGVSMSTMANVQYGHHRQAQDTPQELGADAE